MKLSYIDILGDGERHPITVSITTHHHMSSYGQPVIVLPDDKLLNAESWFLMSYQVVKATPAEFELLKKWVGTVAFFLEIDESSAVHHLNPAAAALGRKGGSVNSPAQNAARAQNGNRGGRPKGAKNKPKDNYEK